MSLVTLPAGRPRIRFETIAPAVATASAAVSRISMRVRRIAGPVVQASITAATGRRSERGMGGA